jgi:hypothetical protein
MEPSYYVPDPALKQPPTTKTKSKTKSEAPTFGQERRPLSLIFKWAFLICGLIAMAGGTTHSILDGVMGGLINGSIVVGIVALVRKVRDRQHG